jgi:DNA primase
MNEVDEIKQRLDIVEVIGSYVPLKQTGANFKGLSPFKTEKTPSFIVSPEKNIWHDFSTGRGGDVFTFVMLQEGLEFRDVLEMLAKKAGVKLKPRSAESAKHSQSKQRYYDANEAAMKYFHLSLSKSSEALKYCKDQRHLSTETIRKFKLGYSPDSWDSLSNFLAQKGFSGTELKQSGLVAQKSGRDSVYDLFRGRLMFPIFDAQKRVVGFSARILKPDASSAKYINTPETPIYQKAQVIYGLVQAKEAIREKDSILVVEGNMDVVSLSNHGYNNVVAVSGTALSEFQLRTLARLSKNILLCFDQDEAGVNATARAINLADGLDARLCVVSYTGAKDPDELIQKDKAAWDKAIKTAEYAPDYLFRHGSEKFDTNSAVGKKQFARFVLPIVASLHDPIEQAHYVKRLAQMLDVDEAVIQKRLSGEPVPAQNIVPTRLEQAADEPKLSRHEQIEQTLLEILLTRPETRSALHDIKKPYLSERHAELFMALKRQPGLTSDKLAQLLPESSNYVKILTLRGEHVNSELTEHDARLEAFTQVNRIVRLYREKQKRQLSRQIATAEANGQTAEARKLLQAYQNLLAEEA